MHWVSRVTVTIVSSAAVQWVFLAFAQGVLSGVSPRLDTRTFCHTWLPHRGKVMGDTDFDRFKRVMGGYKHDGSKGPKYTRWKERFLDDAQGKGDDDWSMADTLMGTDGPQGGIGAAAARARAKRRRQAFSELMNSLDDDSCRDLKTEIRANANGNGRGAWVILERECGETASTLDDGTKVAEWWQLSMEKDTGVNADSIMLFNRLLTAKNSKLQTPWCATSWRTRRPLLCPWSSRCSAFSFATLFPRDPVRCACRRMVRSQPAARPQDSRPAATL